MDTWWGECPKCRTGEMYGDPYGNSQQCYRCGWNEATGEYEFTVNKEESADE